MLSPSTEKHGSEMPGPEAALREHGAKGLCTEENRMNIQTENVLTRREIRGTHCMFVGKRFPVAGAMKSVL